MPQKARRIAVIAIAAIAALLTPAHAAERVAVETDRGTIRVSYVEPGTDTSLTAIASPDAPTAPEARLGIAAASSFGCGPFAIYAAPFYQWAEASWVNCTYVGATSSSTKLYSWSVIPGSSGSACTQGKGFAADGTPIWPSIGCGASGAYAGHWGNVWATPRFRATSQMIVLGAPLSWV